MKNAARILIVEKAKAELNQNFASIWGGGYLQSTKRNLLEV